MDYLIQYITEIQLQYTIAFSKPISVLSHLLFVNGNGIDFLNGNPVVGVSFYKSIPFTEYYKDIKTQQECIEYYERVYRDKRISEYHESRKFLSSYLKLTEEQQWQKAFKEVDDQISSLVFLTKENFLDYDFWYKSLTSNLEYFPSLHLCKEYANVLQLNSNTEINLFKLSKLIVQVYFDFYSKCLNDSVYFNNLLDSFSCKLQKPDLQDIQNMLNDLCFVKQTLELIPNE